MDTLILQHLGDMKNEEWHEINTELAVPVSLRM